MRLFGLKNCDTCRKALKALDTARLVDVRAEPVPDDVLHKALAQFGDALVNTRSTTWRGLTEAQRAEPAFALLRAHPTLMKRPLIESQGQLHLGWTARTRAALGAD